MHTFLRSNRSYLALGALVVVVLGGIAVLGRSDSEASGVLPEDHRAYRDWLVSINQKPVSAVEQGIRLLERYPELHPLYLRLAEVSVADSAVAPYRRALEELRPADSVTALYRLAALSRLAEFDRPAEAVGGWDRVAGSPFLTPALSRAVVDAGRRSADTTRMGRLTEHWRVQVKANPRATGALFGAGYIAALSNRWSEAEGLLGQVARTLPSDPEAYRELGRVFFYTGRQDTMEKTLQAGVRAAEQQFAFEQELILRGNLGLALKQRGDLKGAEEQFVEALAQSRLLSDGETEAFNLLRLAEVEALQYRYDQSIEYLREADLRFAQFRPDRHQEVPALLGQVLSSIYRFSDADRVLQQASAEARKAGDIRTEIRVLAALGQLKLHAGQYATARETAVQAIKLAETYGLNDYLIVALTILGNLEWSTGNLEIARSHYERALDYAVSAGNIARVKELYFMMSAASMDMRDIQGAKYFSEELLRYVREQGDSNGVARAYFGLGNSYDEFRNYNQAISYYDKALEYVSEPVLHSNILVNKAWSYTEKGENDNAISALLEAEELRIVYPMSQYLLEAALGNVYYKMGENRKALDHFRKMEELAQGTSLYRPALEWDARFGVAMSYWGLGDLRRAEESFRRAIATIEALRDNLTQRENRAFFVQDKTEVYKQFAAFLEAQGRNREAFHYMEKARSRSLVDLLYTTQQEREATAQNTLDQMIEAARRRRALSEALTESAFDDTGNLAEGTRASYLRREFIRADSLYRQAYEVLRSSPEHRMFVYDPVSIDTAQATLAEGEALIMYDLRGSKTVAYVVLPDRVVPRTLTVNPADLTDMVWFLRDLISSSNRGPGTGWEPSSRRLYRELIEPIVKVLPPGVQHLHIVPEGVLHYLPFAALLRPDGKFLVEQYTLSVVPSASVLKLSRERNPRRWRSILAVGDPNGKLPGTRIEARAIVAMPAVRSRSFALIGKQATKKMFLDYAEQHDIVHLATHGAFVSRAPWLSHLEFHDGNLTVQEIWDLRLDAYLVTLSACETALSGGANADIPQGEEWVGLNQAFLAAGTPTVLASLWPISDNVSHLFMTGFYDRLVGTAGKGKALAGIQRRFISDPKTRHPFYWAAFTLIGDPL